MTTKLHFYILFIFLTLLSNLYGQGEGNNWYFGNYAGITFSTSPPSLLNDGHLRTSEGCASVSSKDGVLVFYTDGSTVYDVNHNVMPNGTGLYGNPSSTQSSVVCPKPGTYNNTLKRFDTYYIITIEVHNGTAAGGHNGGVRYTEVDMTSNGGLGSIVTARKNVHLFGTSTIEGANIAKHSNGCDYWIIGKEVGNNQFRTYLVNSLGVSTTPVISNAGLSSPSHWGSIKVSPNNKLISFNSGILGTQIFDFNNTNGTISLKFSDTQTSYSSDFSSNNNVLYVTNLPYPQIYQYDLTAINNTSFLNSKLVVGTTANTGGGYKMCGIQLAPDGKIYCSLTGQTRLGAIENPNTLGLGCNYNDNAISLTGINTFSGTSMNAYLALPAFPSFFIFPNELQYESANYSATNQYFCNSDSITFKISDTNSVQSVRWYLSPVNLNYNTTPNSTSLEYTIPPTSSGTYKILSIVNYACYIDSLIDTIIVNDIPILNLGSDIDSCTNSSILIDGTTSNISTYLWNDGTNLATNSYNTTGQYHLKVTDLLGCFNSDTINITVNELPVVNFSVPNTCLNNSSVFNNQSSISSGTISSYQWNFDDGNNSNLLNPNHLFTNDGSYNIQLIATSNNNCKDSIVSTHIVYPIPTVIVGEDTTLNCTVNSIELDGSLSSNGVNFNFLWSTINGNITTSNINDSIIINQDGWYFLTVTNNTNNCFSTDSVLVNIDTLVPNFNVGSDSVLTCQNTSIVLNAINNQTGSFNYLWTTSNGNILMGNNTLTPNINQTGVYVLSVTNTINQCVNNDSLIINIDTISPIAIASTDTIINCLHPSIFLSGDGSSLGNYSYLWESNLGNITTGNTTLFPEINTPGTYLLTVTNNFNGCTSTNQTVVYENNDANVNIIFNSSTDSLFSIFSFEENEITYQGNNGMIEWFINNSNQTNDSIINYSFEESGIHEIVIQLINSENGCIAYDTTNIVVTHELVIPSALSPNGDGYNDEFIIRALENYESNSISIFNRWGESIFEASPYLNDWNGQTNTNNIFIGSQVTDGTYFYIITLQDNGKEFIYKGSIEVKRNK